MTAPAAPLTPWEMGVLAARRDAEAGFTPSPEAFAKAAAVIAAALASEQVTPADGMADGAAA